MGQSRHRTSEGRARDELEMFIKRHDLWRKKYRGDRYLKCFSVEDLVARSGDVLNNQDDAN